MPDWKTTLKLIVLLSAMVFLLAHAPMPFIVVGLAIFAFAAERLWDDDA